jgi:L-asparaginase/Glu-tRNA(Gln) amidotransferase subunit D
LDTHYAPGVAAIEAGAIATGNMTSSAATAKFRWVLARVKKEIKQNTLKNKEKLHRIGKLMGDIYVMEMD